ncbi:MAG: hypothetical protein ACQGVK_04050 [Myxococcota bacterium]
MPEVFAGLSLFTLVAVTALSSLFCLLQPVWSLVDCIESDRERETKVLVSVAILLTWGLGSLVYGLFFTTSRNLRRFTAASTLVMLCLVVVGFSSCVSAIATQAKRAAVEQDERRAEARQRIARFAPSEVAADAVAPFHALLVSRAAPHSTTTTLAEFTLAGPLARSARDVRGGVRHVAHDPERGRTFALTQHGFGALSPSSGAFIEIAVDPGLDFSWPKGLAFDARAGRVVVVTSHVYTRFFSYDPETSAWEELPSEIRDLPIAGLAYLPEREVFYALDARRRASELGSLHRFNRSGALLGELALSPAIPVAEGDSERAQLLASSGKLVLLLPALAEAGEAGGPDRIFLVDPTSGAVAAHRPTHAAAAPE